MLNVYLLLYQNIFLKKTFSTISKGWQYATDSFAQERKSYVRKQQWKTVWHTLQNPLAAEKWFDLLQNSHLKLIAPFRKRLYLKPFRVYVSTKWKTDRKIKVIADTYKFILSKNELFQQVIHKDVEVIRFPLNDTMEAKINLGYNEKFRKEGELVLSLNCDQMNGNIVAISFSFEELEPSKWVCWMGCVQGQETNEANNTKALQKLLFGMRPKAFVVNMMQEICKNFEITALLGPDNNIQAFRKKHAIHLPWAHTINFNYDEFWKESGGEKAIDGWYKLPLVAARRDIYDLKSSKRANYTKRYKMLDQLEILVKEAVEKFK